MAQLVSRIGNGLEVGSADTLLQRTALLCALVLPSGDRADHVAGDDRA